jgi:hypothetical protein
VAKLTRRRSAKLQKYNTHNKQRKNNIGKTKTKKQGEQTKTKTKNNGKQSKNSEEDA